MFRHLLPLVMAVALAAGAASAKAQSDSVGPQLDRVKQLVADGQKLEALEALMPALYEVWVAAPLMIGQAVLVQEPPQGFGLYTPRENASYKSGEPINVYLEPVGYDIVEDGGFYSFGFTTDFMILGTDGQELGKQEAFETIEFRARAPIVQTMIKMDLTINGAAPGDYVIRIVLHDNSSGETAQTDFDVTFVE